MSMKNPNRNKLLSGRLWLTVVSGLSFLIFVITVCACILSKKDSFSGSELMSIINILLLIVSNVMTFYFTKNRDEAVADKKDMAEFIKSPTAEIEK